MKGWVQFGNLTAIARWAGGHNPTGRIELLPWYHFLHSGGSLTYALNTTSVWSCSSAFPTKLSCEFIAIAGTEGDASECFDLSSPANHEQDRPTTSSPRLRVHEQLSKLRTGAHQPRSDRAHGYVQDRGSLMVTHLLEVAELDNFA